MPQTNSFGSPNGPVVLQDPSPTKDVNGDVEIPIVAVAWLCSPHFSLLLLAFLLMGLHLSGCLHRFTQFCAVIFMNAYYSGLK